MAGALGMRRLGAAAAGALLVLAAVAAVWSPASVPVALASSSILARAESEARSARKLEDGHSARDEGAAKALGREKDGGHTSEEAALSKAKQLRNEMKDMQSIEKIRTYSGGGSKIVAEAKQEERRLRKLELAQQHAKARQQELAQRAVATASRETAPVHVSEHTLAREEELVDCEPFCHAGDISKRSQAEHAVLVKKEARERMKQRAERKRAAAEEAAEEQADCIFCKPKPAMRKDRGAIASPHLLDTTNLLKDSDLNTRTGKLSLPSLHAAQAAGHAARTDELVAARPGRRLTHTDEDKINRAAALVASRMRTTSHDSRDVDREMAKLRSSGTSWKALWGSGLRHSDLSKADKSRFTYLAGRSVSGEDRLDHPLSAKTAANPFGNNFHY